MSDITAWKESADQWMKNDKEDVDHTFNGWSQPGESTRLAFLERRVKALSELVIWMMGRLEADMETLRGDSK